MRGAGLERVPDLFIDAGYADDDVTIGSRRQVCEHILVANDHRSFGDNARWVAEFAKRFEDAARDLVGSFDRLVTVRGGAECRQFTFPRWLRELLPEHRDEVRLHQNDRRELIVCAELELPVIAPGIAVVAAVRASTVRIQCPGEGHPLHRVERRTAHDLLITSRIRSRHGVGERFGAAGFDGVRDLSRGGLGPAEIEQQWRSFHSKLVDIRLMFATESTTWSGQARARSGVGPGQAVSPGQTGDGPWTVPGQAWT